MREAAESGDCLEMICRVAKVLGHSRMLFRELAKQPHGLVLIGDILTVLERQVDERPACGRKGQVHSANDGVPGGSQRHRIRSESTRCPAKHVSRELIEQQDERENARGGGFPFLELAGCGAGVIGHESGRAGAVEICTFCKPELTMTRR